MTRYWPVIAILTLMVVIIVPAIRSRPSREHKVSEEVSYLPEAERQRIFQEIIAAEEHARAEANRRFPISDSATPKQLRENVKAYKALRYPAWQQLAKKHGLTSKQLATVSLEGIQNHWPRLGPVIKSPEE